MAIIRKPIQMPCQHFDVKRTLTLTTNNFPINVYFFKGFVDFHGVKNVKIYARKIVAAIGSKIDFSAPDWNWQSPPPSGGNGEDGKHGKHGFDGPQGKFQSIIKKLALKKFTLV